MYLIKSFLRSRSKNWQDPGVSTGGRESFVLPTEIITVLRRAILEPHEHKPNSKINVPALHEWSRLQPIS